MKTKRQLSKEKWYNSNPDYQKNYMIEYNKMLKEKKLQKKEEQLEKIMKEDLWFEIKGYNKKYFINQDLQILNTTSLRFLKVINNVNGYQYVSLDGELKLYHRIIGSIFVPNPLNKAEINHKDGNRWNNAISNLEWLSHAENIQYSFDNLGRKSNLLNWKYNKSK